MELSRELAIQVVVQLQVAGPLKLVVDDTLLHKSGKHVFGLGWFHDAVASTKKRAVTAPGNNWVVLGLAVSVPFTDKLFCLPIHAKLRQAGKDHPGPAELALEMLRDVVSSAIPGTRIACRSERHFWGRYDCVEPMETTRNATRTPIGSKSTV